jgi:hypothetical protein
MKEGKGKDKGKNVAQGASQENDTDAGSEFDEDGNRM